MAMSPSKSVFHHLLLSNSNKFGSCICFHLKFQRALELAGIVENTLVNKMEVKPLLPSQQRRFREVQLPDGAPESVFPPLG